MNLKINKNIAIKYHLNMHLMESLIDRDSIAFEIVKYLIRDLESNSKELIIDNFKFTSKTIKYIFGDKVKDDKFKEYIVDKLKEMIKIGWISSDNKTMYVKEEMLNNFYSIDK